MSLCKRSKTTAPQGLRSSLLFLWYGRCFLFDFFASSWDKCDNSMVDGRFFSSADGGSRTLQWADPIVCVGARNPLPPAKWMRKVSTEPQCQGTWQPPHLMVTKCYFNFYSVCWGVGGTGWRWSKKEVRNHEKWKWPIMSSPEPEGFQNFNIFSFF